MWLETEPVALHARIATWMALAASGCLIVNEPTGEPGARHVLPVGNVHPCTIELEDETPAYWTVCFASDSDVIKFENEMMEGCAWNGVDCTVQCSTASLHPCVLACPGTGIPRGCNASHGCYCPPD